MTLTVYERNGGFPTIRKVVSDFYERVLDSPVVAHHFEEVNMPRLIEHQTRMISFLMGGPVTAYTDQHLGRVHARLAITLAEFDEQVRLLEETLEDHGFGVDDRKHVVRQFRKRQYVIVAE